MKRITLSLLLSSFLYAGSMDSYVDGAITSMNESPGYFKGQTRSVYSLGGGKIRYNNQGSSAPAHLEMPSLKSGCGGIDWKLGGFSFIADPKYYKEKVQAIAAASVGYVFNMAISEFCKDCLTQMQALDKIAQSVNNMSLDSCKASNNVVNYGRSLMEDGNQMALNTGASDDYVEESEKSALDTFNGYINNVSTFLGGDIQASKDVIQQKAMLGSLVEDGIEKGNISSLTTSAFGSDPQGGSLLVSMIRAMVGDVVGYKRRSGNDSADFQIQLKPIAADASFSVKSLMIGGDVRYHYLKTNADHMGEPVETIGGVPFVGIRPIFQNKISGIIANMRSNTPLTASQRQFINALPVPIYRYLNTTVLAGVADTELLSDYLAIMETHAFLDSVISMAGKNLVANISKTAGNAAAEEVRNYRIAIVDQLIDRKKQLEQTTKFEIEALAKKKDLNDYYKELEQGLKSQLAGNALYATSRFKRGAH